MQILTFVTKLNQIPGTFLWRFSLTFGLAYSPLNSAKLSCSSEVTLLQRYITTFSFFCLDGLLFSETRQFDFLSFQNVVLENSLEKVGALSIWSLIFIHMYGVSFWNCIFKDCKYLSIYLFLSLTLNFLADVIMTSSMIIQYECNPIHLSK